MSKISKRDREPVKQVTCEKCNQPFKAVIVIVGGKKKKGRMCGCES